MDNFKGGKFIVGTDLKADESKRMASELFRNQNENMRMVNENIRNETVLASKNSFFTQIGLFVTVLVIIIILTVIAILAYEKATNNQSLVDLDNLRDLKLSNLTVLDSSTLDDLTVKGTDIVFKEDITADKDINLAGGISVTGSGNYDSTLTVDGLLTANGGLSVAGGTSVYSKADLYSTLNVTGSAQYDSTLNVDGLLTANGGLSVLGGLSVYSKADFYNTLNVTGSAQYDSTLNVDGLLTANGGLSVVGGLSVAGGLSVTGTTTLEKARIKKKDVVYASALTGGVCNNHYTLSETSETGQTILVDYRITPVSGTSIDNTFVLPNLTSANTGVNYEFIWSGNNLSGTSTIFSLILDHTDSSNIYGIVNAGQNNNQPITLTLIGDKKASIEHDSISTTASKAFHYTGKIYPGSKINCLKDDEDWLITGNLGVCDPVDNTTDGFINTSNFSQILLNNYFRIDHPQAFGSFYNEKFLPYQTNVPDIENLRSININDITFGREGINEALWFLSGYSTSKNFEISGVVYKSTTGKEWTKTTFDTVPQPREIAGVTYGTSSDGTDIWLAYGVSQPGFVGAIYYSSTGDNWQNAILPNDFTGVYITSIAYGTSEGVSTFVAVDNGPSGTTTTNIYYSTNGTSFQNSNLGPAAGTWNSVAYGLSDNGTSGLWVVGGASVLMYYSENAIDWQPTTGISGSGTYFNINSIAFGSSGTSTRWVASSHNTNTGTSVFYSNNGVNWQNSNFTSTSSSFFDDCKVKFGRFLDDQKLWYLYSEDVNDEMYNSTNGIEWNRVDSPFTSGQGIAIGFNQPLYPLENNAYDS